MKIHRRDTALAGAGLLAAAGLGASTAQAQGNDRQAVAQAIAAMNVAMIAVDRAALEALSHDAMSYGHSAGRIESKQQFVSNVLARTAVFRRISLSEENIVVVGAEAIARHILSGETVNQNGGVTQVNIGVLQVWHKDGAAWRLLARQAYRI